MSEHIFLYFSYIVSEIGPHYNQLPSPQQALYNEYIQRYGEMFMKQNFIPDITINNSPFLAYLQTLYLPSSSNISQAPNNLSQINQNNAFQPNLSTNPSQMPGLNQMASSLNVNNPVHSNYTQPGSNLSNAGGQNINPFQAPTTSQNQLTINMQNFQINTQNNN